jgi:uncharacterized phiE125 gp8 family phage protein
MTPATPFVTAPWQQPLSVSSVLVDGPTFEPLTLDEGKLRAGLDWAADDARDDLMKSFIAAARSQVEHDTGLALPMQTRDVTYTDAAIAASWLPLPVQAWPVQSVTAPDGRVLDASVFTADPSKRALQFSTPMGVAGTWRIIAGWPTVDALKAEAPLLVHAVGLLTAHYATLGRDLASEGHIVNAIPMGYDEAIAPYRLIWMP